MLEYQGTDAMAVAAVYRCVNVIADVIARLPIQIQRKRGPIFVDESTAPLHYLLNEEPCEWMSAFDMRRQAIVYLLLKGNAYIVPTYSPTSLELERLVLVNPMFVTHDTEHDTYQVTDIKNGVVGVYDESEIIHLKNYTLDGKHGLSTLRYARTALDIASRGDYETLKRFSTGGNVRGILSNSAEKVYGVGEYQDDELDKLASDIGYRLNDRGENIVATHGQAKLDIITMSSADMQFLESRKFQVLDICRFFGVPPFFVFSDTSNNYKSTEMAELSFFSDTLAPLINKIETELNRKLIGRRGYGRRRISFDVTQMHPMDNASRAAYIKTLLETGATMNEVRRYNNLPPVEGGDSPFFSANLKTIEMLQKEASQNNTTTENDTDKKDTPSE